MDGSGTRLHVREMQVRCEAITVLANLLFYEEDGSVGRKLNSSPFTNTMGLNRLTAEKQVKESGSDLEASWDLCYAQLYLCR